MILQHSLMRLFRNATAPWSSLLKLYCASTVALRFHLRHNAYAEAVDLLIETQRLPKLLDDYPFEAGRALVDQSNFQRICLYLLRCGTYMADPDDLKELRQCAFCLYERQGEYSAALSVALQIGDDDEDRPFSERCKALFDAADNLTRKQMGFLLARHRSNFEYVEDYDVDSIIGNNRLNCYYVWARVAGVALAHLSSSHVPPS